MKSDRDALQEAMLIFHGMLLDGPGLSDVWRQQIRGFLERETVPSGIGAYRPAEVPADTVKFKQVSVSSALAGEVVALALDEQGRAWCCWWSEDHGWSEWFMIESPSEKTE